MTYLSCCLAGFLRHPERLVLVAFLWATVVPGRPAQPAEGTHTKPSGALLVCKEYGTVVGTFITDSRGRDLTRLNFLFGADVNPRFSPKADRVLFASARGGTPGLWLMRRNGGEQERISEGDQGSWFPDGQRILFRRQGQIVERSLPTGDETVLSPVDWKSCSWPDCSPDGQTVIFVTTDGDRSALWQVVRRNPEPHRIAEGEILSGPRFGPTGERIVFQKGAHLWMINADGSNPRQLTTTAGVQSRPAWSPDGLWIAYSQAPNPKGPWQMALIASDGSQTLPVAGREARSVLCADWGGDDRETKVEPARSSNPIPPRLRLWQTERPASAERGDWSSFCRARTGWKTIAAENTPGLRESVGWIVENDRAIFVFATGSGGVVMVPKPELEPALTLSLLDTEGIEAGSIKALRITGSTPDEVALETMARSTAAEVRATWTISGSRALVQVRSLENASQLRLEVPMQAVVAPDRFGNDIIAEPRTSRRTTVSLPWAPLVLGLIANGSGLLTAVCPDPGQSVELRSGPETGFASADVKFQNRAVAVGLITSERTWHLERNEKESSQGLVRFNWRIPGPGAWRLAAQADNRRYSEFLPEHEPGSSDSEEIVTFKREVLEEPVRSGVIYLYGRTGATPPETLTPVDILRDALGLAAADRVIDEQGITGYRKAAGPATWAELSVTLDSLRYLFERQLEVQDGVYARHLVDDLPLFLRGADERLAEYARFARDVDELLHRLDTSNPAMTRLADRLGELQRNLIELGRKQLELKSGSEVLPLTARISQLTDQESSQNRAQFERCRRQILDAAAPREALLREYRKAAIQLRDRAGAELLARPELLAVTEQIRVLSQGVLRNRFYVEADWRGEDYTIPAFWLGPRPYE